MSTIHLKLKENRRSADYPLFTGLILYEKGLADLQGQNDDEREAIKELEAIRAQKVKDLQPHVSAQELNKIKRAEDPNTAERKILRATLKPILEKLATSSKDGTFKMQQVWDAVRKSEDPIITDGQSSIGQSVRLYVKVGKLLRPWVNGKFVRGIYYINKKTWGDPWPEAL